MAQRFRRKKRDRGSRTARPLTVTWQLDVTEPDPASGTCTIMLVDARQPEPLAVHICTPAEVPDLLASTLRDASESRREAEQSPWPDRVEVRLEPLARYLGSLAQREGFEVSVEARLLALEAATRRVMARLQGLELRYTFVPDLPLALYEAAADLFEAAPWRQYADRHVLELSAVGDEARLPWSAISILGGSALLRGLSVYPDHDTAARLLQGAPEPGTALNLWFREAADISELEAELYRVDGWPRRDVYPSVSRLSDEHTGHPAIDAPDDDEVDALIDALEAVLLFVEEHPAPPVGGTRVQAEWHDGRVLAVTHRPLLDDLADSVDLRSLAPFVMTIGLLDCERALVAELDSALGDDARLGELDALPDRVGLLSLRARKAEIEQLLEALDALAVDALSYVPTDEVHGFVVAWSGDRVVGRLMPGDRRFGDALAKAAGALGGQVLVAFSGGGARRRPGSFRERDLLAVRRLAWRRD